MPNSMSSNVPPPVSSELLFSPAEAQFVVRDYVCGLCNDELHIVELVGEFMVMVVCYEHGNVVNCGRVTRTTVSLQMERAHFRLREVARNMPQYWGMFIPVKKDEATLMRELGF